MQSKSSAAPKDNPSGTPNADLAARQKRREAEMAYGQDAAGTGITEPAAPSASPAPAAMPTVGTGSIG